MCWPCTQTIPHVRDPLIHNRELFLFSEYTLGARYCYKSCTYINSFNPYNDLLRERFYRSTNLVIEMLNSLPKIKQLVSGRVSFNQAAWLQSPSSYPPSIPPLPVRREAMWSPAWGIESIILESLCVMAGWC